VFHGREDLENQQLHLQVYKQEIEVSGTTELMPDVAIVDVAKKAIGDSVTGADFSLPTGIKLVAPETEIYAVIKAVRKIAE
jgi:large subunit ribosomal protein L25